MATAKANSKTTPKKTDSTQVKTVDLSTINKNVRKVLAKRKANK